jgi:hypothetical protein
MQRSSVAVANLAIDLVIVSNFEIYEIFASQCEKSQAKEMEM